MYECDVCMTTVWKKYECYTIYYMKSSMNNLNSSRVWLGSDNDSAESSAIWISNFSANSPQVLKIFQGVYQGPKGRCLMNKTKIAISETVPLTYSYTSLAAKCHTKLTIVLFHFLKATYFWSGSSLRQGGVVLSRSECIFFRVDTLVLYKLNYL
jgi:hypothetical protein